MTREAINFSWLIKLRWGAIAGQIVTILGVARVVGVELPLTALFAVIAVELLSNVVCVVAARRRTPPEWWCGMVMALDVVLLTALLHLTGGPFNPFSFLYLVEISLAAVILRARWTWTLVLVSLVGSGALFVGPRAALVSRGDHMQLHLRGMWVAFGVAATFIVYFLMRVRRDLEARELDLVAAQRRGARQERLASLATLAAGAAHELATPLGTIALAAKELERRLGSLADSDADTIEDVQLIRAQVSRCRGILDSMAAEAGQSAGEPSRDVPVAELLRSAVDGLRAEPPIEIELGAIDGQRLCVPPRAVAQAVKSLLKNAQDASAAHTPVRLCASISDAEVRIEVLDRGSGMAEAILARAGEPFFTTKEPGRGMGLGLFLTRTVVEQLGGQLALSAREGGGTRALVTLPAAPAKNDRIGSPPPV
jgi:two-component system sensor histidine kinase RegB